MPDDIKPENDDNVTNQEELSADFLLEPEEKQEEEAVPTAADFFATELAESASPEDALADVARVLAMPEDDSTESVAEPEPVVEVVDDDEESDLPQQLLLRPVPDDGIRRRWYAIHAHSGQEANVRKNIEVTAEIDGLSDMITNVFVPMEEVAEIKAGQKKLTTRKFFPGYVLVQLPEHPERHAELWHLIKDVPGVTGFIGSRTAPVPLEDSEVEAIVEEIRGERERPKPKVLFDIGERVKIIEGPFTNFLGNVDEVNQERGKIKVLVEIFERLTSVEVEFWQIEKV